MKIAPTLKDHAAEYLDRRRSLNYSPRSVQEERYTLQRLCSWLEQTFECTSPGALCKQHLDAWQKHLCSTVNVSGRPITARTVNKHLTFARSFLGYLADRGHVQRRLVNALERLREPRTLPRSVLTHGQVRKLLDSIDTGSPQGFRDRTVLELLYTSGIRARELTGLDLSDVDLEEGVARVTGKGSKERVVPIGRTALRFLRGYIVGVRPEFLARRSLGEGGLRDSSQTALFLNARGDRFSYRSLQHCIRRLRKKHKLEQHVTAHTFDLAPPN